MKTKQAMKKITNIGMAALVAMGMLGTSCNKVESRRWKLLKLLKLLKLRKITLSP